jgi:hypothetical protein
MVPPSFGFNSRQGLLTSMIYAVFWIFLSALSKPSDKCERFFKLLPRQSTCGHKALPLTDAAK